MIQRRGSMPPTRRKLVLAVVSFITVFHLDSTKAESLDTPPSDSKTRNILMRGAHPETHDAYLCTGYHIAEEELFIYKFEALANASTAHHMLLYGCSGEPFSDEPIWRCPAMCRTGRSSILFAWAKNAPPTVLPKGVGLRIGQKSTIKTIVLQVHYAKSFTEKEKPDNSGIKLYTTRQKQPYVAGIFLMMSTSFQVPPKNPSYPVDMSCVFFKEKSIFPFAYRTHAHGLGKVITGYQWNGSYHEIGKGNPQWPQAFYPVHEKIEVKPGDALAARCTYDSTTMSHSVRVGATGNDEMCNFYIMFYTESSVKDPSGECVNNQVPDLTGNNFPDNVSVPLPPNPALEEEAKGHHHHHHGGMAGGGGSDDDEKPDSHKGNLNKNVQILGSKPLVTPSEETPHKSHTADSFGLKNEEKIKAQMPPQSNSAKESKELFQFDYDFNDLSPRDVKYEKRHNHEYYDDFAANDLREKGMYHPTRVSEEELSRNRNKDFEAMNKQMQSFPRKNPPPRPLQEQQIGHSNGGRRGGRPNAGPGGPGRQTPPVSPTKQANGVVAPGQPAKVHSHIQFEHSLVFNSSWPGNPIEIGQVGGIATDKEGNLYIFHRGSRIWSYDSFNMNNDFTYQNDPIAEDVVLILDSQGRFVRKFGAGQYFMPHGIEVDHEGNIWLTDVALHQVFKIPPTKSKPSLVLGKKFQHSEDTSYFCKPTDVAVLTTGEFYVSDGYCNSRILKFSKDGKLLKFWGQRDLTYTNLSSPPGVFNIPHSITVSEENKLVCVADRENGRIQCFDLDGNFKHIIQHSQFGPKLFAIEQCPMHGGVLFAVNGPAYDGPQDFSVQGFTLDIKTGDLLEMWNVPQHLKNPHDVCVHPSGHSVYVGELNPQAVWKFSRTSSPVAQVSEHEHHHETPEGAFKIDNVENDDEVTKTTTTEKTGAKMEDKSGEDTATNTSVSSGLNKETKDRDASDFTPSIIIGVLLVVPVVLLLVITLLVRAHQSGKLKCFSDSSKRVFTMQGFLGNSHKGFDPLSTEESDHDIDPDDSDHEEYLAPQKIKSKA